LKHIHLAGLGGKVAYAQLLNDGSEVRMTRAARSSGNLSTPPGHGEDTLTLELPIQRPDVAVPVVALFLQ
jgi:alpha-L-fucosidase